MPAEPVERTDGPARTGWVYRLLAFVLVIAASATALQIALATPYNTHPDEITHADGFCYFESHWLPPPPNADGIYYAPQGLSRVYYGEVVYIVYGRITALVRPWLDPLMQQVQTLRQPTGGYEHAAFLPLIAEFARCQHAFRVYRVLNVLLYAVTLGVLLWVGRRNPISLALALLLVATPQALYVYAYANSDAWGLSGGIFLFLFAYTCCHAQGLTRANIIGLGGLTGLVLLSKEPFWLLIPLAYVAPALWFVAHMRRKKRAEQRGLVWRLLAVALVAFLVAAPLRLFVPLAHEDYGARMAAAREARAEPQFRPSSPLQPGFMLARRGVPFSTVATDATWWRVTAQSFYGLLGYMNVPLPRWSYIGAVLLMTLLLLGTVGTTLRHHDAMPWVIGLLLMAAPLMIGLNLAASLLNSWIEDFQPQGRYLLPSLVPLAVLLGGSVAYEAKTLRRARAVAWAALIVISLSAMWYTVLSAPFFH